MSQQRLDEALATYLAASEELLAATEERVWEHLPVETHQVVIHWLDDVDSSRLWFERALDVDGEVLVDESTDTGDVYDDVDQLVSGLADDWDSADSRYLRIKNPAGIDDRMWFVLGRGARCVPGATLAEDEPEAAAA